MKLSSKLILFVVLPSLVVLVGIAGWLRSDHRARAIERAQVAIEEAAASGAAMIVQDTTALDGILQAILSSIDGPLEADDAQAARLAVLCEALLRGRPELLGLDLSNGASELVFSLSTPGTPGPVSLGPHPAKPPASRQGGLDLVWHGDQQARLVRFGESLNGRPPPSLTALLDLREVVAPAAALAARLHAGSWVEFSSPDRRLTYTTLASRHLGQDSVLMGSQYLEQPTRLGILRVVQPQALALAHATEDTVRAFVGLGFIALALLVMLGLGLYITILRPLKNLMATVDAFERGELLPQAPSHNRDELGTLATSLRSALTDVAESQSHLQQLNTQLETEVSERTGQLRRYTHELSHARTETEAANKARAEFLANISHEVRTPLNGIIGMTELLLGSSLDEQQREYTQAVQRAGNEMLRLMTDVLDFSVLKRRQLELEETDFSLGPVINEVCDAFAEQAQQQGLSLRCDVDDRLPPVLRGDNERLGQILTHLLDNALKFTEQGTVELIVTPMSPSADGLGLRFEVRDSGIGIPAEERERLFEPFTQEDGSNTRKYGGAGIGLAMSQLLAEALGGTLGVESTVGTGSTFWFTAVFGQAEADAISETRGRALLNGLRVLVVDDSATNRTIFSRECQGWGMEPVEAESGNQALELAAQAFSEGQGFDLVLLDMQMPDMNGLQTAQLFKQDPALADIPLVMLTSASTTDAGAEDRRAGISARLTKPIHQQQLLSCLTRLLADAATRPAQDVDVRPPSSATSATRSSCRRILIVEDNVVNQKVALSLLARLGYEADVANHGGEAVEAVASQTYGAVLMDCQMPVMDGFAATREIRRSETGQEHIPILAMTASGLMSDRRSALAAGMNDYITKPVRADELREMLARWIEPDNSLVSSQGSSTPARPADEDDPPQNPPCEDPPMSSYDQHNPETSAQLPPADAPAPIDESVLDGLRAFQDEDGPDILTELIGIFLDDTPPRLQKMVAALGSGDTAVAEAEGHALKSSCAQLGATGLSEICRQVEMAGKKKDLASVGPLAVQAQAEFLRVEDALQAMRSLA